MADYKVTDTQLTSVANAIRAKTGKSAQIEFPTEFVSEIGSISGGGDGKAYYENDNGTIGVLIEQKDGYLYQTWYFNGFEKTSSDVNLPNNLNSLQPATLCGTHAYANPNDTGRSGMIGFYSGQIRTWSLDASQKISGTFYGTLYLRAGVYDPSKPLANHGGAKWQDVLYTPPSA